MHAHLFLLQQCSSRPSFSVEILSMICVSYHLHAVGNALCNRRPWSEQKQPCHAVLVVHLYQVSLQRIEPIIISKIDNLSTCRNMVQVVSISLLLINLLSCNFHTNRKGYNARPAHYCSSTWRHNRSLQGSIDDGRILPDSEGNYRPLIILNDMICNPKYLGHIIVISQWLKLIRLRAVWWCKLRETRRLGSEKLSTQVMKFMMEQGTKLRAFRQVNVCRMSWSMQANDNARIGPYQFMTLTAGVLPRNSSLLSLQWGRDIGILTSIVFHSLNARRTFKLGVADLFDDNPAFYRATCWFWKLKNEVKWRRCNRVERHSMCLTWFLLSLRKSWVERTVLVKKSICMWVTM